jgi:triacylglycerol lipase
MSVNYAKALKCATFSQQVYDNFEKVQFDSLTEQPARLEDVGTDTQGVILTEGRGITIVFRGSSSRFDWRTNFIFDQERAEFDRQVIQQQIVAATEQDQMYPYSGGSSSGALMHRGFVKCYFAVRQTIHDFIDARDVSEVTVTGHSLGGALATLCAVDVQYNFASKIAVDIYTFGAPKVGNAGFRDSFHRRVPNSFRFVNGMDIVPELPRWWQGYRHVDAEHRIGQRFSPNFLSQRFKDHAIDRYINLIAQLAKQ